MSIEEIAKEIIIAMIQKGHFDQVDKHNNQTVISEERITHICKSYIALTETLRTSPLRKN